jgi:hypothetical protein
MRGFTRVGCQLDRKYYNIMKDVTNSEKRSSLLWHGILYYSKKFYYTGPLSQCYKTFSVCNLQMFVIS